MQVRKGPRRRTKGLQRVFVIPAMENEHFLHDRSTGGYRRKTERLGWRGTRNAGEKVVLAEATSPVGFSPLYRVAGHNSNGWREERPNLRQPGDIAKQFGNGSAIRWQERMLISPASRPHRAIHRRRGAGEEGRERMTTRESKNCFRACWDPGRVSVSVGPGGCRRREGGEGGGRRPGRGAMGKAQQPPVVVSRSTGDTTPDAGFRRCRSRGCYASGDGGALRTARRSSCRGRGRRGSPGRCCG
jgi:hypothetical protein